MATLLERLLQFHEADPEDSFTRFALAQEYLKSGNEQQALDYFEGLVRSNPEYTGTYYHLGNLLVRMGRKEDAMRIYEAGILAARRQKNLRDLAELQDALLALQGIGEED